MPGIMTEQPSERVLVERARGGDREAFDAIVRPLEDRLRAFIRSRLPAAGGESLDPEEVLGETLVRAFGSVGSFRGEDIEAFRRWITGVAQKTILRARDEARRHLTLELPPGLSAGDTSPTKGLRRKERLEHLQGALDALDGDHRQVIFLTRIEGLSLKEAAERMGRSPEAVRKLFWRALRRLRSALSSTESLGLPDEGLEWEADRDPR